MFSRITEVFKPNSIFPNISTLGYYDHHSQLIFLNNYNKNMVSALNRGNTNLFRDFINIALHELNHFYDHTSTLWGQRYLVLIHNAITAFIQGDPKQFWRINELNRISMRTFYSVYYSTIGPNAPKSWDGENWKYKFSTGLEFNHIGKINPHKPIVFTRFSTKDDTLIARVPLSISSLLETNSVYAELVSELEFIQLLNNYSQVAERIKLNNQYKNKLYDPNFTVYSVAAHCLANNIKEKNIVKAYKLSSVLSRFCLNLPLEYYKIIIIPNELNDWGERNINLLKAGNIGYLYLVLTFSANKYVDGDSIVDWLSETIKKAGLPCIKIINERIHQLMLENKKRLIEGPLKERYSYLLDKGLENYEYNGIYNSFRFKDILDSNIIIPPLVLGDDSIFNFPCKSLDETIYDITKSHDLSWDFSSFIDGFLPACIT